DHARHAGAAPRGGDDCRGGNIVQRPAHGCVHVRLDFALAEGAVVDADLVDEAIEVFAPDRVAADPQRAARIRDAAGEGPAAHEDPVDVQFQTRAVIGFREVAPGVQGESGSPQDAAVAARQVDVGGGGVGRPVRGVQAVGESTWALLHHDCTEVG